MKQKRKKQTEKLKTLLELHQVSQDRLCEQMEISRQWKEEQKRLLFGTPPSPDPRIAELHKEVEEKFEKTRDRSGEGPPLLHVCFQYDDVVKQSSYEKSIFSSIIHEADNLMDKVTGDEDDSDFETTLEIEEDSSFMGSFGIGKTKSMPELRILVAKVTNANKICYSAIESGKMYITLQCGDKTLQAKSRKKTPDYRHRIGFSHVFSFRGMPIEQWFTCDIKIEIKVTTKQSSHRAFALLSPNRSVFEENIPSFMAEKVVTSAFFWKDYLNLKSQEIYEYTIPLICPDKAPSLQSSSGEEEEPMEINEPEIAETVAESFFSVFDRAMSAPPSSGPQDTLEEEIQQSESLPDLESSPAKSSRNSGPESSLSASPEASDESFDGAVTKKKRKKKNKGLGIIGKIFS